MHCLYFQLVMTIWAHVDLLFSWTARQGLHCSIVSEVFVVSEVFAIKQILPTNTYFLLIRSTRTLARIASSSCLNILGCWSNSLAWIEFIIEFKMSHLAFHCLNDSVSCHRMHSGGWTIASSLRCFRGYSCASMPDVDNRSLGFHSCLPQGLELSQGTSVSRASACLSSRRNSWRSYPSGCSMENVWSLFDIHVYYLTFVCI